MTDQDLLAFNARGFIPGPTETEEQFLTRIQKTEGLFQQTAPLPRAHWEWTKHTLKALFDFEPESLMAYYSNKHLLPWQGAACWIDEEKIPQLQLRKAFAKGHYLRLYSREEILAHEAIHAARAAFDEPENEEFFAYSASEKRWRQVLGPIVKRPWEIWVLMGTLGLGLFWEGGIVAALFWISLGVWRLTRQHLRRRRAAQTLRDKDVATIRAILLRLTDSEIRQLAKGLLPTSDDSLRWRLLRSAYNFSSVATIST